MHKLVYFTVFVQLFIFYVPLSCASQLHEYENKMYTHHYGQAENYIARCETKSGKPIKNCLEAVKHLRTYLNKCQTLKLQEEVHQRRMISHRFSIYRLLADTYAKLSNYYVQQYQLFKITTLWQYPPVG